MSQKQLFWNFDYPNSLSMFVYLLSIKDLIKIALVRFQHVHRLPKCPHKYFSSAWNPWPGGWKAQFFIDPLRRVAIAPDFQMHKCHTTQGTFVKVIPQTVTANGKIKRAIARMHPAAFDCDRAGPTPCAGPEIAAGNENC